MLLGFGAGCLSGCVPAWAVDVMYLANDSFGELSKIDFPLALASFHVLLHHIYFGRRFYRKRLGTSRRICIPEIATIPRVHSINAVSGSQCLVEVAVAHSQRCCEGRNVDSDSGFRVCSVHTCTHPSLRLIQYVVSYKQTTHPNNSLHIISRPSLLLAFIRFIPTS